MLALALGLLLGSDAGVVSGATGPIERPAQLAGRQGKVVTVVGVARDAKGGAVVLLEGEPLYVRGLDAWPKGLRDRRVEVTGTLRDEKLIPSPVVDSKGAISQGAEGNQLVLDTPTWRAL